MKKDWRITLEDPSRFVKVTVTVGELLTFLAEELREASNPSQVENVKLPKDGNIRK